MFQGPLKWSCGDVGSSDVATRVLDEAQRQGIWSWLRSASQGPDDIAGRSYASTLSLVQEIHQRDAW